MLTLVIISGTPNSEPKDSIVSIKSFVIVDLPLAVSPAIPIEAGMFIFPEIYADIFLIAIGLYDKRTELHEFSSFSKTLNKKLI